MATEPMKRERRRRETSFNAVNSAHMWRPRPSRQRSARRNTISRHTFIFITQSSRSWNEIFFLHKRYQSEKSLESPTFSDRLHVALIVVGFDWKMILFLRQLHCHDGDKFHKTFACAMQRNELLQPRRYFRHAMALRAHKFRKKTFSVTAAELRGK